MREEEWRLSKELAEELMAEIKDERAARGATEIYARTLYPRAIYYVLYLPAACPPAAAAAGLG